MHRQTLKKITFTFTLILMVVVLAAIFGKSTSEASASFDSEHYTKHYESIEVHGGDSLWSIAEDYAEDYGCSTKEYIKELKEINGLNSDYIRNGSKLIVVYFEEI